MHQHVDGRVIGVRAGGNAVHGADQLGVAGAAQHHAAFSVLDGLRGIGRDQLAFGTRQRAEMLLHQGQHLLLLDPPAHQQHGVVRLVVHAIEGTQALDGHVLDVGTLADDGPPVVVPGKRELRKPLPQDVARVVLAGFELVAHHRHFRVQVLLAHEGVHHPVGLHRQCELEVLLGRGKGFEVVGAVEGGGAVPARTALHELFLDVRKAGAALEQHVLEQVRHAFLAVAFVARADQVGDVDGDRVHRAVRHQHDAQAVGQAVLADPFDGGHALRGLRKAPGHAPQDEQARHQQAVQGLAVRMRDAGRGRHGGRGSKGGGFHGLDGFRPHRFKPAWRPGAGPACRRRSSGRSAGSARPPRWPRRRPAGGGCPGRSGWCQTAPAIPGRRSR